MKDLSKCFRTRYGLVEWRKSRGLRASLMNYSSRRGGIVCSRVGTNHGEPRQFLDAGTSTLVDFPSPFLFFSILTCIRFEITFRNGVSVSRNSYLSCICAAAKTKGFEYALQSFDSAPFVDRSFLGVLYVC